MADLPKATLDRLLWLPKSGFEWDRVQMELRRMADVAVGEGRVVEPWEMTDTHMGVPREWGLARYGRQFEIVDETLYKGIKWPALEWPDGWGYRKGQRESVNSMLWHFADPDNRGGLLQAFCGSGKTLMGLNIAAELNVPVLVLVHKDDLAQQWHETLKTFWPEANAGHIQGDKWVFRTKHMVTAMAQTLHTRKDSPILPEMHKHFGMVILDEGHRYSAATFEHILRALPIRYRLGVSATWRRKDGLECLWDWHVGRVVHVMEGSRLTGEYVQIPWKTNLVDAMFKRGNTLLMAAMTTAISKNVPYNIWLATQITSAANAGRRVLVCSDRVAHVLELSHRIRELGFTGSVGHYVAGIPDGVTEKGNPRSKKMSKSELEAAKTCDVVLASYGMISEGTDVPELDTLFLATPRSDVEQVVGRIQRPSGDKRPLLVVDPVFQLGVCHGMAAKRRETYSELGFTQQRKEE